MITLQSKNSGFPQSVCEYQASKDGRYGWFLCTSHEEGDHVLEEIQTEIKLGIMNSGVMEVSKMEIDHWLKNFCGDFHWKLHASLRKTELREKGISLFLGVFYGAEVHFVQFGRLFCSVSKGKKLEFPGKTWKNFHVQSMADLNLFGQSEEDIRVKPQRILLEDNERMYILPGAIATKVFTQQSDPNSLVPVVESFVGAANPQWLILKNVPTLERSKKKKLTKWQISSFFLLLATLAAILYMAFGNRSFDVLFRKARLERIPDRLKVDKNLIKYWEGVVNSPARSIELSQGWSADLPYQVTAAPAFDAASIYVASEQNLSAFDKKTRDLLWNVALPAPILSVMNTKYGLVVNLKDNRTVGVSKTGELTWNSESITHNAEPYRPQICELTNAEDPRIDGSVTVIPLQQGISIVDSQQGNVMSQLTLTQDLQFLSRYDNYDSCFYAVVGDTILRIAVKIVN